MAVQPATGAAVSNGRNSLPGAVVSAVAEIPAERPAIHMSASTVSGPATKPLPEYPNSNRRVMNQVRKYGKLHTPGYAWSSSTIPPFAYLPPSVPSGPVAGWMEKQDRLQQILGGNDSEDEEVLVDHSYNGELGGKCSSCRRQPFYVLKSLSVGVSCLQSSPVCCRSRLRFLPMPPKPFKPLQRRRRRTSSCSSWRGSR